MHPLKCWAETQDQKAIACRTILKMEHDQHPPEDNLDDKVMKACDKIKLKSEKINRKRRIGKIK
jgi:hypothetical protein